VLILSTWLVIGTLVGVRLERLGHPSSTSVSALVAWPVLLPLMQAAPLPQGPYARDIAAAFTNLQRVLHDPAAGDVPWTGDLAALQSSLAAADARLAMVDRLLGDGDDPDGALTQARSTAAEELVAVLRGVDSLRMQVGLYALEGGGQSVQDALRALQARATALSEVRSTRWTG